MECDFDVVHRVFSFWLFVEKEEESPTTDGHRFTQIHADGREEWKRAVLPEKRMVWIEDFRKQTDTRIVERVSLPEPRGRCHPSIPVEDLEKGAALVGEGIDGAAFGIFHQPGSHRVMQAV